MCLTEQCQVGNVEILSCVVRRLAGSLHRRSRSLAELNIFALVPPSPHADWSFTALPETQCTLFISVAVVVRFLYVRNRVCLREIEFLYFIIFSKISLFKL